MKTITAEQLSRRVAKAYSEKKNWRATAAVFDINPGLAYRIAVQGYEPKNPALRTKLGLSALALAPTCTRCGEVHVARRCVSQAHPPARRRFAIYADDAESAARSIEKHMSPAEIERLVQVLKKE